MVFLLIKKDCFNKSFLIITDSGETRNLNLDLDLNLNLDSDLNVKLRPP